MEITQAIHASISGIQRPIPGFNSVMTSMEKRQEMKVDIPSPSPAMAQSLPLGLPRGWIPITEVGDMFVSTSGMLALLPGTN